MIIAVGFPPACGHWCRARIGDVEDQPAAPAPICGVLRDVQTAYDNMLADKARDGNKTFVGSCCDDTVVEAIYIIPWKIPHRPDLSCPDSRYFEADAI